MIRLIHRPLRCLLALGSAPNVGGHLVSASPVAAVRTFICAPQGRSQPARRFAAAPRRSLQRTVAHAEPAEDAPEMVAGTGGASSGPTDPKLVALRQAMAGADGGKGVDVYVVPTEDPHMSEIAPASQERRAYISGFTGSAGTAVVTKDQALLWTDGRYFLQAGKQLGPGWKLMKGDTPGVPELSEWLAKLPAGARVGIDPFVHTNEGARKLLAALGLAGNELVPMFGGNLVDAVWEDAPPAPTAPLRVHPLEFAGRSVKEKLQDIRKQLKEAKADAVLITALDETAWLFNMRGGDVDYNPIFVSYGLVTAKEATLFVDGAKVTEAAAEHLKASGVTVKPYEDVLDEVRALGSAGKKLWVDPAQVSYAFASAFDEAAAGSGKGAKRPLAEEGDAAEGAAAKPSPAGKGKGKGKGGLLERKSPVSLAKAVKNEAELAGMREAHLRDAEAICDFLAWIEKELEGGATVSEVEIDKQLTGRRAAKPGFVECSFPTIAGVDGNGAIIHYRAAEDTCSTADSSSMLLLDSGAQYDCGTTDITRTVHFGTPSDHQRRCFTAVLKGHIALDSVVFPHDTPGLSLDTLARHALWQLGLDYRHGTGHGVGAALNVHEGPHSISKRYHITTGMQAGMVVSNEPGYYEEGAFGIRIENLVAAREAETPFKFGDVPYLSFERLTQVPFQRKLMDIQAMTQREREWVDGYHAEVWDKVSPRVSGAALEWLRNNTAPLEVAQAAPALVAA